ncbi:hypothetical protein EYF80_048259 [Liparis tanakae]|uniref:Uncharacterized protein n=1 Tax=Liparis tanakae TaxID=230148 RepID=A0A4Z2FKP0_9TELE|nr:hypothetical protein EYF80_048259 [Liparis tanakae]
MDTEVDADPPDSFDIQSRQQSPEEDRYITAFWSTGIEVAKGPFSTVSSLQVHQRSLLSKYTILHSNYLGSIGTPISLLYHHNGQREAPSGGSPCPETESRQWPSFLFHLFFISNIVILTMGHHPKLDQVLHSQLVICTSGCDRMCKQEVSRYIEDEEGREEKGERRAGKEGASKRLITVHQETS